MPAFPRGLDNSRFFFCVDTSCSGASSCVECLYKISFFISSIDEARVFVLRSVLFYLAWLSWGGPDNVYYSSHERGLLSIHSRTIRFFVLSCWIVFCQACLLSEMVALTTGPLREGNIMNCFCILGHSLGACSQCSGPTELHEPQHAWLRRRVERRTKQVSVFLTTCLLSNSLVSLSEPATFWVLCPQDVRTQ